MFFLFAKITNVSYHLFKRMSKPTTDDTKWFNSTYIRCNTPHNRCLGSIDNITCYLINLINYRLI